MSRTKIHWLSPKVIFEKAPAFTEVWKRYMVKQGWDMVDTAEEADIIFFSSDSVLDERLVNLDKPKLAYFWGFLHERLCNPQFAAFAMEKIRLFSKCTLTLVPSLVTYYQACDLGLPTNLCLPGIDTELYDSVPDQPKTDQVMFISRFAPYKRLDMLIEAMSMIKPQPPLLVAGAGEKEPYEQLARRLGVEMRMGELSEEEKAIELKRSAILVHPTEYGCYSTPPFEAFWCRTPCIVSDIPVHHWLFRDAGIYINNTEDLQKAIVDVLEHPDIAASLAQTGRQWTEKYLTLDKACWRLEQYINSAVEKHTGIKIREAKTQEECQKVYDLSHKLNWDLNIKSFDITWERHWRAQYFINALKECGAHTILDVGSGVVFPVIFAHAGFEVVAIDISLECLNQIAALSSKWGTDDRIAIRQASADRLPYQECTFDGAILGEILEHVPEPRKVIAEALRVTKVGGFVIGSTPVGQHHDDPLHLHHWDDQTIKELLKPWERQVRKLEKIAEEGKEPSCYFVVIQK